MNNNDFYEKLELACSPLLSEIEFFSRERDVRIKGLSPGLIPKTYFNMNFETLELDLMVRAIYEKAENGMYTYTIYVHGSSFDNL
jgi:hypothetical protein